MASKEETKAMLDSLARFSTSKHLVLAITDGSMREVLVAGYEGVNAVGWMQMQCEARLFSRMAF